MVFTTEYQRRSWYYYELSRETAAILKSLDVLGSEHACGALQKAGEKESGTANECGKTTVELIGSVFKFVLWPFILAVSLGLRLTKVTADVTGWAH